MAGLTLRIHGMHCIDCGHKVEAALTGVPGVTRARVHYLRKQADVAADDTVSIDQLKAAVAQAGYQVLDADALPEGGDSGRL
jgi:copper chaperone CopZ